MWSDFCAPLYIHFNEYGRRDSFSFWLRFKWNSDWYIIKRRTVTTIIFLSIWKESETNIPEWEWDPQIVDQPVHLRRTQALSTWSWSQGPCLASSGTRGWEWCPSLSCRAVTIIIGNQLAHSSLNKQCEKRVSFIHIYIQFH